MNRLNVGNQNKKDPISRYFSVCRENERRRHCQLIDGWQTVGSNRISRLSRHALELGRMTMDVSDVLGPMYITDIAYRTDHPRIRVTDGLRSAGTGWSADDATLCACVCVWMN